MLLNVRVIKLSCHHYGEKKYLIIKKSNLIIIILFLKKRKTASRLQYLKKKTKKQKHFCLINQSHVLQPTCRSMNWGKWYHREDPSWMCDKFSKYALNSRRTLCGKSFTLMWSDFCGQQKQMHFAFRYHSFLWRTGRGGLSTQSDHLNQRNSFVLPHSYPQMWLSFLDYMCSAQSLG